MYYTRNFIFQIVLIVLDLNTLVINHLSLASLKSYPGGQNQSALGFHSYLFMRFTSLYDTCRDAHRKKLAKRYPCSVIKAETNLDSLGIIVRDNVIDLIIAKGLFPSK